MTTPTTLSNVAYLRSDFRFPIRDSAISRFHDFTISRFHDFAIPQFGDFAVPRFRDSVILRFRDFTIPISRFRDFDFAISRMVGQDQGYYTQGYYGRPKPYSRTPLYRATRRSTEILVHIF